MCKNGWTDCDAVLDEDLGGPKKACGCRSPKRKEQFLRVVRVIQRCWQSLLQRYCGVRSKRIIQSPIMLCSRRDNSVCQSSASNILKISAVKGVVRLHSVGGLISAIALLNLCDTFVPVTVTKCFTSNKVFHSHTQWLWAWYADVAATLLQFFIFAGVAYTTAEHSHATLLWSPNPETLDSKGFLFVLLLLSSPSSLLLVWNDEHFRCNYLGNGGWKQLIVQSVTFMPIPSSLSQTCAQI